MLLQPADRAQCRMTGVFPRHAPLDVELDLTLDVVLELFVELAFDGGYPQERAKTQRQHIQPTLERHITARRYWRTLPSVTKRL